MRIKMPAVRIAQGQLVTSLKFNAYLIYFAVSLSAKQKQSHTHPHRSKSIMLLPLNSFHSFQGNENCMSKCTYINMYMSVSD